MPKKRSPGEGALYFDQKRKLWRGVVDVGFTPDGRRRQKAVTARTQTAAREKLRAVLAEIKEHGQPIDKSMTVKAWADHWLATVCKPNLKPNTYQSYESMLRTWILPQLGRKKVALIKPSDIRLVSKAVSDAGRSSSTALKAHNIMSVMFEAARLDKLCARNVVEDVTPPKAATTNQRDALPLEHTVAVLEYASRSVEGTRWWVALLQGLRQGERLGAQIDSLDFDNGVFRVEWALDEVVSEHGCGPATDGAWPCGKKRGASCPQGRLRIPDGFEYRRLKGRLCLVRPKSGKTRLVPLIPQLAEPLKRYLAATAHIPNPYNLIWRHDDGSPFLPGEEEQMWRDVLLNAGVITPEQALPPRDRPAGTPPPPDAHCARHTTATVLGELGVSEKIIGEIVGHEAARTTRRYQHVSSDAAQSAMQRLGDHLTSTLVAGQLNA